MKKISNHFVQESFFKSHLFSCCFFLDSDSEGKAASQPLLSHTQTQSAHDNKGHRLFFVFSFTKTCWKSKPVFLEYLSDHVIGGSWGGSSAGMRAGAHMGSSWELKGETVHIPTGRLPVL